MRRDSRLLRIRLSLTFIAAGLTPAIPAAAQTPTRSVCQTDPAFATLDFWVGEWNVFAGEQQVGHEPDRKGPLLLRDHRELATRSSNSFSSRVAGSAAEPYSIRPG